MGTIDIFEPRTMLSMVSENEFRAKTFLRDRYFGHTETFQTESVDVDVVGRGKRKVAPFVSRRSGGSQDFRDGYTTNTFKPAYVAPFRVTTAEDALKRSAGEAIYSSKSPNQRAAEILAKDLYDLDKEITRREELMCAQALTTGKIIVKEQGSAESEARQLDFWHGLSTKPYVDLSVTSPWNVTNADPMADLRKIVRDITKLSGLTPVEVIAGSKAVDALINALKGDTTAFNSRRIDLGQINPSSFADGVGFIGTLRLPQLDIYTYDEWYYDDDSHKDVPLIPEDSILIACRDVRTTRAYGVVDIINVQQNAHQWLEGDRVPNSWLQATGENAGRIVQIKSAPLMVVHEPLGFWVVKVVS